MNKNFESIYFEFKINISCPKLFVNGILSNFARLVLYYFYSH